MRTKILFSDLDDTLLDFDKNVSAQDLDSINRMIKAGHRFVIATGRPVYSAKVVAKRLGLYRDGIFLVSSNGAAIYDCGSEKLISSVTVDPELVGEMFDAALAEGLHIHTYTDTYIASLRETEEIRIYSQKISMPYRILERIPEDLPSAPPKFVVMSIKQDSRKILEDFQKRHSDVTDGKVQSVFSNDYLLEYLPPDISKGRALRNLCELSGIPVEDSIAVGDEANDIPMLDAAGLGIVVKNGTDEAKSHAGYVTEHTNNESAISEIIGKFVLN
ncbi:MAG: Cof-type HAD-IIB family hydrolase [Lachnospiraceae bacterium]|nr:Cof-type HAD-IIB family hydrolase [Lachnospiraceae bacterium]